MRTTTLPVSLPLITSTFRKSIHLHQIARQNPQNWSAMGNHRKLLLQFLRPDPAVAATKSPPPSSSDSNSDSDAYSPSTSASALTSPSPSPYAMSPWTQLPGLGCSDPHHHQSTGLLGSLVKADGHVYSLAAAGDLLYTGTDSRNVRVWRDRRELGGFRSGSGLVKAIVVAPDGRIFTGHQDGKVRVWRRNKEAGDMDRVRHRRVGSLPRVRDVVASSLLPSRCHVDATKHVDAVSCLSLDAAAGLLYSASWDKTFKVWRVDDSRCIDSVRAHDDAVNAVAAAGFDALLLTGSADGTVKVWRREVLDHRNKGRRTRHALERVLRKGDGAVTAIAVAAEARVVYVGTSDGAVAHWQFPRLGGAAPRNGGAMRGHGKMAVLCLAAAGRVVVSGSADRTVCVWRREAGADHARLAVLRGHAGPVKCVAMDQEDDGGERRWVVYSGSLDGSVKVWRVSDNDEDPMRTPPAHGVMWNGRSPMRSWMPYAAAPEPKRLATA